VLNSLGARFNGTTWFDRTNYFVSFPASDENLAKALDLEADRMVASFIARKHLDSEMTVVRNEFEASENDPIGVTMDRAISTAFDWHNYGHSTIGCRADIENVSIERLQAFYRRYYQPDNAVLLVAGKIDEGKTLALVTKIFGAIPRPERKLERTWTLDPVQDGERSVTVRRVGDTQSVMAVYKIPAGTDPDAAAIQVLSRVMTDAPSGRLYKALVETKKATRVFPMYVATQEPGFIVFAAELDKTQSLDAARDAMIKVLEQQGTAAITTEEVERGKQELAKYIALTLNESDRLGIGLSEFIAIGDWRMFFINRDRIKAVAPANVQKVAGAYFRQANRTMGQFIATAKPARAEIPPARDVAQMVKDYKGQAQVAAGEAFDTDPMAIEKRIQYWKTPIGLSGAVVSKKTRGQTVQLTLRLQFGDEKSLSNLGAAPELVPAMLMRGTAKRTRQQLKDELDRLKSQVNVSGGPEGVGVMVTSTRENLPAVLRIVAEVLREPAFPQKELQLLVDEQLTDMEAQRQEPSFVASDALQRHMNPYPKGHPRYGDTLDESIARLKAVKVEELRAFHKGFYGASNGQVVVVGDVDATQAQKLIGELFGGWRSPAAYQRIVQRPSVATPMQKAFETPDKANAFFTAGLGLLVKDSDPEYPAMLLANYILGGGALKSRLADRIRQKEGLSYGVGSYFYAGALDKVGGWGAYAIYAPENAGKLEAAFKEELAKALKDGFPKEEVDAARQSWLQAQSVSRAQDRELSGRIAGNLFNGRTMAFSADLEKRVRALGGADLLAGLRKYLDPNKVSYAKAGDFAKSAKPSAGTATPARPAAKSR
jgi:zinc protease